MTELESKQAIADALRAFHTRPLAEAATTLLKSLGYYSERRIDLASKTPESFLANFDHAGRLNREQAKLLDWQTVDFLFQLTGDEIQGSAKSLSLFETDKRVNNQRIESYLFFAIHLKKSNYTRNELATITRAVNRLFPMPAMLLFRYGNTITLSVINRRLHKHDESKDVLEKVTLVKDIQFVNPHRAHVEILYDLSLDALQRAHGLTSFVELHNGWRKALDSSELNKRFYQEIANWYFWACDHVRFPKDAGKDKQTRNAVSLIRLITRLIFVWFVKEKGLIPDDLFDQRGVGDLLKNFGGKETVYYKAILQNLFFATLNTEMNTPQNPANRRFRGTRARGRDQHYMIHNLYRYRDLLKDPDRLLELLSTVPFLNGGLFECLDRFDEKNPDKAIRIDGFSDRPDNEIEVPDYLFFAEEKTVDLNEIYGTKNKRYKVRGLIDIFGHYKFTITENTPIEEEIALDPELLGRVFENLLASYNPETETTARKQTGSFYTPREIVNYMVDESLIIYLERKLNSLGKVNVNERLRHLLAYNDQPHQFTAAEVDVLINAIDNVKILDPACGSGAFPMGILHKLVHILAKLDQGNEKWKQRQIDRVKQAIRAAEQIEDATFRERTIADLEQQIADINDAFERNELDYGRKLYLIENCIYGVDIQPIACQIAKLRFFISLVADQKIDDDRLNRGIRPLPNLETKFVAANTLLTVEKPAQLVLRNEDIDKKEKELGEVRRKYLTVRSPRTKAKYREQDNNFRAEIALLLRRDGFPRETTEKLARWDPYDQNASADFLDGEWMFGITHGFDICIGNPPYGVSFSRAEKQRFLALYRHQDYQLDSYLLFTERAFLLLGDGGILAFIIPNPWLTNLKLKKFRRFIFSQTRIQQILHYSRKVFDAVVDNEVVIVTNELPNSNKILVTLLRDQNSAITSVVEQDKWIALNGEPVNIFFDPSHEALVKRIERDTVFLKDLCDVTVGMKPYQTGKGNPKQTKAVVEARIFDSTYQKGKSYKPLLRGRDIQRYVTRWDGKRWIKYGEHLAEPRPSARFDAPEKIVIRQTGDSLIATLDRSQFVCMNNMHTIVARNTRCDLKFILGLLNSRLLNYYFQWLNPEKGEALAEVKKEHVEKLVIKCGSDKQRKAIADTVDRILTLKGENPDADITDLEAEIDQLVYSLYGLTDDEVRIVAEATADIAS